MTRTVDVWFPTRLDPEGEPPHLTYVCPGVFRVLDKTYCGRTLLSTDLVQPMIVTAKTWTFKRVVEEGGFCLECLAEYMAEELRGGEG